MPSWRFWGGDQPIQEWLISTNFLSPRFEIGDRPDLEQFLGCITECPRKIPKIASIIPKKPPRNIAKLVYPRTR